MSLDLRALRDSFEGVIPSSIATLDADGLPNVSYLSHVFMVDEAHVALTNQFFSKTMANVRQSGRATLLVVDGRTGDQHILHLVFEASLTDGELFARMDAHLRAMCLRDGMSEIMRLRGVDLYRVETITPTPSFRPSPLPQAAPEPPAALRLADASLVAARLAEQTDIDALLDVALSALGLDHAMILTPDASGARLATIASRGYGTAGVGSEVTFGEGAIGIAAETRRPVRISDLSRGRRMAEAAMSGSELDAQRIIPLPGLPDAHSQLAVPMVALGRLQGVIVAEATERFAFTLEDEAALVLIAAQLAACLRLLESEIGEPDRAPAAPPLAPGGAPFRARYFAFDDSLFIDDAYVIKGVPGRLLFHFLRAHLDDGRRDFTNREIRLDASLRLPDLKDNLETRLILLKRRLDEKAAPVRLSRPGRGLIRLELDGAPSLEVVANAGAA